jgi:hypothetical protein
MNTVINNSNGRSSTRAFLPRSRGFIQGHAAAGPAVVTITFVIRWRNGPGHTVYRLCLSAGEKLHRRPRFTASTTKTRPFRFNKKPTVYEAKEEK